MGTTKVDNSFGGFIQVNQLNPEEIYEFTPEEEKMLDEAETEDCISNEEAKRRTRECLNNLAKSFTSTKSTTVGKNSDH